MRNAILRRGLYLVTRETDDTAALLAMVSAALEGGAVLVQYRDKSTDAQRRHAQARALRQLCQDHGVPLLVNDDAALARAVGAAGVHLGRDDMDVAAARAMLGSGAIIGASCYDDIELAHVASGAGADYLAFGAFHPSPTKPHARRARPELLADAAALGLPRVAIGGITPDNARALVDAGADLLAVVSAVFDDPDPRAAALAFSRLYPPNSSP